MKLTGKKKYTFRKLSIIFWNVQKII